MRAEHRSTVHVAAPRQRVWDLVTAWERQGEWIPLTRVWRTGGSPGQVGETLTGRTGIGRLAFDDTMTVIEVDEPVTCRVEHTGQVVRGTAGFRLVELPDSTLVVWEEQVDIPGGPLAPLLWRVMSPFVQIGYAVALRRLARLAERS